jgi:hypothetical protein
MFQNGVVGEDRDRKDFRAARRGEQEQTMKPGGRTRPINRGIAREGAGERHGTFTWDGNHKK